MTKNLQTTIKATLKITQYHNKTSKEKNKQKNSFKKPHVNTKFRSLKEIFLHTSISRSLENSGINKKPLSFCSPLHFCSAPKPPKIFHAFHFLLRNSLQLK